MYNSKWNSDRRSILLDRFDDIKEFFDMPFTKEFIRYNDIMLRSLASVLEVLGEKDMTPEESAQLRQQLMSMTRRFMRSAEMTMSASSEVSSDELEILDMKRFFDELAEKCEASSGGSIHLRTGDINCGPILTSADILRYIFLGFIRKTASHSGEKDITLEVSSTKKDDGLYIRLDLPADFVSAGRMPLTIPEIADKYPDEMCKLLASRIGAELVFDEKGMLLRFVPTENSGDITLSSGRITPADRDFSPFDIMLGDFDGKNSSY